MNHCVDDRCTYRTVQRQLRRGIKLVDPLVMLVIIGVGTSIFIPVQHNIRETSRRGECNRHLQQIGLALKNYHDVYGAYPPAYTVDEAGRPLHSWRTLLLPHLDQQALYERIDFSKAWDDPANVAAVAGSRVPTYECPSSTLQNCPYLAVVTPKSALRPGKSLAIREITDGTRNTLLVIEVESEHAVPWMSPRDVDEKYVLSLERNSSFNHPRGGHILLADGIVRLLDWKLHPSGRQTLISAAGGDNICGDF